MFHDGQDQKFTNHNGRKTERIKKLHACNIHKIAKNTMKASYFGSGPKFPISHRGNLGLTPGLFLWETLWIKWPIRPTGFSPSPSVFHGQCYSINAA
jgi:hypothetical protein